MPETFVIPDYGFVINGQPDRVKVLSPGKGPVFVDRKQIEKPTKIKHTVLVTGEGYVTLGDEDE